MLLVSRIEIVIVTVLAISTLILYAGFAARRWYETVYGRVVFTILASFALAMSLACATIYFSLQSPWIQTLRAATYFFVIIAYVHIFVSIFRVQRNARKESKNEDAFAKDA